MRKQARFMIVTLLMLLVPALANAWTLTVKVTGGNDSNFVRVNKLLQDGTLSTVIREVKNGTVYLYPSGPVRISLISPSQGALTVAMNTDNGITQTFPRDLSSGSHTIAVAYDQASVTGSLNLEQAEGGQIHAQNRNSTWSATGVKGIEPDSVVPVTIAADYNHRIAGYYSYTDANNKGSILTTGLSTEELNTLGGVKTLYLEAPADGITIEPEFALVAKISASLFAPTDGAVGRPINCNVVAASNVAALQYAVTVTDPSGATVSETPADSKTFSFTPADEGVYTITVTVRSTVAGENTLDPTVLTAKVNVVAAVQNANAQCTSCHGTSFPDKENPLAEAIHSPTGVNADRTCASCHLLDRAHSTSGLIGGAIQGRVLSSNVEVLDFATLTTGTASGAKGITTDGVNLFVTDGNSTTYQIAIATGTVTPITGAIAVSGITTNGADRFTATNDITTDDVYLYRIGSSGVDRALIAATLNWETITGPISAMRGITTDGINIYVTAGTRIYKVPIAFPTAAAPITTSANLVTPIGITTDGTNLYVVDEGLVQKVDPYGNVSLIESIGGSPYGITTDGFNLYVTDSTNRQIRMLKLTE